jgi:hypothetical protein
LAGDQMAICHGVGLYPHAGRSAVREDYRHPLAKKN